MSRIRKVILVCALALLNPSVGIADEIGRPSVAASKNDMSLGAAYSEACVNAVVLTWNSYFNNLPLTDRASANVKMCNGHPDQMVCETMRNMLAREFGKSPQTCGTNTAKSVPQVFPNDVARSLQ
jgi:hypothetical protein